MRPHALSTALVAALAVASWSPAITLAQGSDVGPLAEAVGAPPQALASVEAARPKPAEPAVQVAEPARKPSEAVAKTAEPATKPSAPAAAAAEPVVKVIEPIAAAAEPVVKPAEPVAKASEPIAAAAEPVVKPAEPVVKPAKPILSAGARVVAAPAPVVTADSPGAPRSATPVATRTSPTTATRVDRARTSPPAAAMPRGAESSQGADETRVVTDGGSGSSTVGQRDGGVEHGLPVDAAVGPAAGEFTGVVGPPTAAPSVIAAAGDLPRILQATPTRVALPSAAGSLSVAGLRARNAHPAGFPARVGRLSEPALGTRRLVPHARRVPGEPRTATPGPSAAASSAPTPSGGTFALLAATLAGAATIFSVLVTSSARRGPIPFISLLERPG